ncbi:hypothetical protein EVAR_63695_1 [Eumeta japonica]|uniref:Uncharacterized protein n=1 Tax=Eumeta variegata TaxID=151549 RepID=A0A4C1ZCC4_EUMVA|nr:hypothetical protein EVAR_63695_1 [Eumeta japonica]
MALLPRPRKNQQSTVWIYRVLPVRKGWERRRKCAYELHMELCLCEGDQSEAENRSGLYGTTTNRCSERM